MRYAIPILALAATSVFAQAPLEQARAAYERTNYNAALQKLEGDGSAAALALAGKAHYGKGDFKQAVEALEKATAVEPGNAGYRHWLGKAYGRRAENASFLTAAKWAGRCRDAFEKSVELDSGDIEAASDLFSYYIDAPGFLGGGLDKAGALAERIRPLDEPQYHFFQAELARKKKEYQSAERHLRRAVELAPTQAGRLVDLARFLADRDRHRESDAEFGKARALAPDKPAVLFEMASAYIEAERNPGEARKLLRQYLAGPLTPQDPPRREAEKLLDRVKSE